MMLGELKSVHICIFACEFEYWIRFGCR